ncbi:hypothetical protein F5Y17DRAFT_87738 [Xylariaceae sp. FL0594]|nr:hypothetical protein F5Y17DRAFT_87738 [Xylariaceae sp. FL0594]
MTKYGIRIHMPIWATPKPFSELMGQGWSGSVGLREIHSVMVWPEFCLGPPGYNTVALTSRTLHADQEWEAEVSSLFGVLEHYFELGGYFWDRHRVEVTQLHHEEDSKSYTSLEFSGEQVRTAVKAFLIFEKATAELACDQERDPTMSPVRKSQQLIRHYENVPNYGWTKLFKCVDGSAMSEILEVTPCLWTFEESFTKRPRYLWVNVPLISNAKEACAWVKFALGFVNAVLGPSFSHTGKTELSENTRPWSI